MPNYLVINGTVTEEEKAVISVLDHGFLYGDGLFTTIRVEAGRPLWFDDHWQRLCQQATVIHMPIPWEKKEVLNWLLAGLKANGLVDAYVRVTVSRGQGPLGLDFSQCKLPNCIVYSKPLPAHIEERQKMGIKAGILSGRHWGKLWPGAGLKSLNFLNQVLAFPEMNSKGWQEGVYLTSTDHVAEGTVSNIFWFKDGILFTPSLETGILNGIMRQKVIEMARMQGITIQEGLYYQEALLQADEIFITNSISEIVPIVELNGQSIGKGVRGDLVQRLLLELKNFKKNC
ncbi:MULTISPECIES: aminodeoxychorismate lyase [unclassified Carboxydocella]|uniref:aminodeoxychorismate lyase n=1 Tax=unclassified Carboxydocella TaxID=2685367 RepID=UPI0009AC58FB|nr:MULTISPECIES: aminodeoxychorismate lyase [unclassified Carboxydocella]GAW27516.1 4-amino-4-deoxychorismate lyase [Carboxydocella sp. ULO1]GAW32372.1 4-amino-4-deoxychorismate lyase [Carboxydocella sp. JDF658]